MLPNGPHSTQKIAAWFGILEKTGKLATITTTRPNCLVFEKNTVETSVNPTVKGGLWYLENEG